MSDEETTEAGWHPDPTGRHQYRYHDGSGWTDHVSDAGATAEDPLAAPVPAVEPASPEPTPGPPSGSRRKPWLIGGSVAVVVAAVVVVLVLVLAGGDGGGADPLVGRYEGGGQGTAVALVVAGEPPALSELSVEAACGNVSLSQTIEFSTQRPIDDGRFELTLPPPGGFEIDGTFVDEGRRVEGRLATGDCAGDWTAEFVGVPGGPAGDVPTDNAVRWEAPDATLSADNFYVVAGGRVFTARSGDLEVDGDPGGDDTTIEVTWSEHDREMRLFVYLESDEDEWWAYEIRTYDGTTDGDWVYFEDRYFTTPVGSVFRTDVFELQGTAEDTGEDVLVHFEGLAVETTLTGGDESDDDEGAADTTVPPSDDDEPAVGPPIAVGDEFDVAGLTLVLEDAYFDCARSDIGVLCPADLDPSDQPLTIVVGRAGGDPASFEDLTVELVDRDGTVYPTRAATLTVAGGEPARRTLTFALPDQTDELEIVFGSGERFDLAGGLESDLDGEVEPAVFSDDFDGTLEPGWEWLNEDPPQWSVGDGTLSIVAQQAGPDGIPNVLVRPAPDAAEVFLVTTRISFQPTSDFQFAGLVLSGDDPHSTRLQFGRAFCTECVGDGVYFDRVDDGAFVGDDFRVPFAETPWLYLQMAVIGGERAVGAYSFDGDEWFPVGEHEVTFDITRVGLVAHQAPAEITAEFDFFELQTFEE